jgi:cobalt-zinc-cadmium efflux system outer membrane protein
MSVEIIYSIRRHTGILLMVTLGCAVLFSRTASGQDPMMRRPTTARKGVSLKELLASTENHPELRAANASTEAARSRVSMQSSLMDPMIILGVNNLPTNSFRFDAEMMTSKSIGLSQTFPFPGKLSKAHDAAMKEIDVSIFAAAEKRNALRRDVKKSYYELFHLSKSIATYDYHLEQIEKLLALAHARLSSGIGTAQEILQLEMDRTQAQMKILEDESTRTELIGELSKSSGYLPDVISWPDSLLLDPVRFSVDQLDSIAQKQSPLLARLSSQVEQDQLSGERAHLDRYPDFDIMLMYMQRDALAPPAGSTESMVQSNMFSAELRFNLPLGYGGKLADREAEAAAMSGMHQSDREAMHLEIRSMLQSRFTQLEVLRKQYALLVGEMLPRAIESSVLDRTNYALGKSDLTGTLSRLTELVHQDHDRYRIEADYHKLLAEIEYLVGTDLFE